jgi:hypothetical protein
MQDLDPSQYGEADRREVDPPVEVESATWSTGGQLDGGSKNASSGWAEYGARMDVNAGSKLLIFVRRKIIEDLSVRSRVCRTAGVEVRKQCLLTCTLAWRSSGL